MANLNLNDVARKNLTVAIAALKAGDDARQWRKSIRYAGFHGCF